MIFVVKTLVLVCHFRMTCFYQLSGLFVGRARTVCPVTGQLEDTLHTSDRRRQIDGQTETDRQRLTDIITCVWVSAYVLLIHAGFSTVMLSFDILHVL